MDLFSIAAAAPASGQVVPAMHAADRFVAVPISILFWAIIAVVIAISVQRTNRNLDERSVPLMGVMAAFIFAAQMFNFQVAGGTSGHLLGGLLAAILLGPWAATLVMASVIGVQGLLFSDGGLVVMGANIFNMGVIGTLGGYALYRGLCAVLGGEDRARIPASAIAGWASVVAASVSMSLMLIASGTSPAEVGAARHGRDPPVHRRRGGTDHRGCPGVHPGHPPGPPEPSSRPGRKSRCGGTGGSTGTGPCRIPGRRTPFHDRVAARPKPARNRLGRWWWVVGIAIAALIVVILAPLASPDPDGLERVAEDHGFIDQATNFFSGPVLRLRDPGR